MKFKDIVRKSYNKQATHYLNSMSMQTGNLKNLLHYFTTHNLKISSGAYLDIGCGTGLLAKEINDRSNMETAILYTGIDISEMMIKIAKKMYHNYGEFIVADTENLPFNDNSFNYIFSNSVFHWLHVPEEQTTCEKAFRESYRVLFPGGIGTYSIAGKGTAKRFQKVYRNVIDNLDEKYFLDKKYYRYDPIGSMSLDTVIDLCMKTGFTIVDAKLQYEPVKFKKTIDYVSNVEAYGYDAYMYMIKNKYKKVIWKEIQTTFSSEVGSKNYFHDQYMIYIIIKKPE